jgi:hypothetical protein
MRVKFPIRGWERGHMTGYHFKDMDSLIVGRSCNVPVCTCTIHVPVQRILTQVQQQVMVLCFAWTYVRTCNAIESIVTINFCWIRQLIFTLGQATWNRAPPQVEAHALLLPQAKAIYLRNTPFHRLYLKVNYLPQIPQNKFILLNLFSKDSINNIEN